MFWRCSCTNSANSKDILNSDDGLAESLTVTSCFDKFWPHGKNKKIGTSRADSMRPPPKCTWTETDLPKWVVAVSSSNSGGESGSTESSSVMKVSSDNVAHVRRRLSTGNAVTQRFLFAHEKLLQKLGTSSPVVMNFTVPCASTQSAEDESTDEMPFVCQQSEQCLNTVTKVSPMKVSTGSLPQMLWVWTSLIAIIVPFMI